MNNKIIISKFLNYVSCPDNKIIYHSLYGNPIQIDDSVEQLINCLTFPLELEDFATSDDDCLNALEVLIRLGYVIYESKAAIEYEKWKHEILELYNRQPPLMDGLVFLVTTDCNLSCKYCIASHTLPKSRKMTYSIAKVALKNYTSYLDTIKDTNNIEPMIIFTGGEPLLQFGMIKQLCEFISIEYPDYFFKYRLITNGTLIDTRIAEFLKLHKFDIIISLDGDQDVNDFYRLNSEGFATFCDIWQGIETLVQNNVESHNISLSAVYHEDHPEGISEELFNLMLTFGIKNLTLNLDNLSLMVSSPRELAKRFVELRNKAKSMGIIISGRWAVPAQNLRSKRMAFAICSATARSRFFVQPDGTITFCDYHPKVIGSVHRLKEYISYLKYTTNHHLLGSNYCRNCPIQGFCSPCVLEQEVLHTENDLHQKQKCEFLKTCTNLLTLEK